MKCHCARCTLVTVHRDFVMPTRNGPDLNQARRLKSRVIVVARLFVQSIDGRRVGGVQRIGREQRVKAAPVGVKGGHTVGRGNPGDPQRMAASFAAVIGFPHLKSRGGIVAEESSRHRHDRFPIREIILQRNRARLKDGSKKEQRCQRVAPAIPDLVVRGSI